MIRAARVALAVLLWWVPQPAAAAGAIHGTTTTQQRAVVLPGVELVVIEIAAGREAAVAVSDANGRFRITGLQPGRYRLRARLAGFKDLETEPLALRADQDVEVNLDLELAPVTETVKVIGEAGMAQTATSISQDTIKGRMFDVLPVSGDSYRALLPVLPGVVRAPDGRISVKGARPTQGGLRVGRGNASDPSTGNFGIELPADSVESVNVLPNPYGAEDGRFSSSLVRIETRSGTNTWHATANSFVPLPCLKICDGGTMGIRYYAPRVWFGGPLARDRLFLAQGVQYRFDRVRVPSLPEDANDTTTQSIDVFTRLDANVSAGHVVAATLAFFPRRVRAVGLNTFNPVEVTPNSRLRGYNAAVADNATLSPTTLLESSFSFSLYDTTVSGQGERDMQLTTEGNRGNFFNTQTRQTRVYQWSESLSSVRRAAGGEHLLKAGLDVMYSGYRGTSRSRPVIIRRVDGTVSQRFDFGGPTSQRVTGADVAFFAQDRWRVVSRLLLEPGVRFDRDGTLRRSSVSPRVGVVVGVLPGDTGVLRGGVGAFYDRTPLNVGAFESFEVATLTRFAADGITPVSPPLTFVHRTGRLETPRSLIWNLEYDHRFGSSVFLKVNHLRRRGSREAVVEPWQSESAAELRLDSGGGSRYVETEVTVRLGRDDTRQLTLSYVRSHSTGTLNAYDVFYGNFRNPVVRPDQYSLAPVDVPNRFLARGSVRLREKWTLSSIVEARAGFPYSIVNQDQEYIGVRNAGGRFPNLYTVDVSLIRAGTIKGRKIRYGVQGNHVFNSFNPRDVQNNIDSPRFGTFYNSLPRTIGVTFQFIPR